MRALVSLVTGGLSVAALVAMVLVGANWMGVLPTFSKAASEEDDVEETEEGAEDASAQHTEHGGAVESDGTRTPMVIVMALVSIWAFV